MSIRKQIPSKKYFSGTREKNKITRQNSKNSPHIPGITNSRLPKTTENPHH